MATIILSLGVILPMAAMGVHQLLHRKKSSNDVQQVQQVTLTNIPNETPPIQQPVPVKQDSNPMFKQNNTCASSIYNTENRSQLFRHLSSNPVPITTHFVSEKAEFDHCENRYADKPMRSSALYVNGPKVDMPMAIDCKHTEIELKDHQYNPINFVKLKEREYKECNPQGKKSIRLKPTFAPNNPNAYETVAERELSSTKVNYKPNVTLFRKMNANNVALAEAKPRVLRANVVSKGPSKQPYRKVKRDIIDQQDEQISLTRNPKMKNRRILPVDSLIKHNEQQDRSSDPKHTFINKYNSKRQRVIDPEINVSYVKSKELVTQGVQSKHI